jgi:uncharacterized protein (DUF433 family)
MSKFGRITMDAAVANGLACIRDTGITVSEVVKAIQGGKSVNEVAGTHEGLTVDDVVEAQGYALERLVDSIGMARFDIAAHLGAIQGYGDILAQKPELLNDKSLANKISSTAVTNSRRTMRLLWNLQDWSRLAFGTLSDVISGNIKITSSDFLNQITKDTADSGYEIVIETDSIHELPILSLDYYFESYTAQLVSKSSIFHATKRVVIHIALEENIWMMEVSREFTNSVTPESILWLMNHPGPVSIATHVYRKYNSDLIIKVEDQSLTFRFRLPLWQPENS